MNKELDLLEFLQYIVGCDYISDLKNEPYNSKAKLLLSQLDVSYYSLNQIKDATEYIYSILSERKNF
jgi:hypothetical protein